MKFSFALVGVSALLFQILSIGVVSAQTTSPRTASPQNPNNPLKDLTSPDEAAFWKAIKDWDATPVPFATLCKNKDKPGILGINVERRHTVDVLLEVAGTQDCEKAEAKLKSLTSLSLFHKQISDFSPLESLTNLTTLDLTLNNIVNLKPLVSLINLTTLDNNKIINVKLLGDLSKLTNLSLRHNRIVDVTSLSSLNKLTNLNLSVNQIVDVKPLASLNKLTTLDLYRNQIKDVTSLAGLNKLTNLDLRRNSFTVKVCPLNPASICKF